QGCQRMTVEGESDRGARQLSGQRARFAQDALMAQVHPVEGAQGDRRRAQTRRFQPEKLVHAPHGERSLHSFPTAPAFSKLVTFAHQKTRTGCSCSLSRERASRATHTRPRPASTAATSSWP